jgi:type II secretory pathway pseudopilin PulG
MNYELRIKKSRKTGYTIIETMIAVSLFIIIVMIGMGALLNANLIHQKSQSMRSIIDNLSFVMEDMSKNLRTGYNYQCFDASQLQLSPATLGAPRSCATGWAIAFEAANGVAGNNSDQWVYYINNGKIFKSIDGATTFVQLTPDEIFIEQPFGFSVVGAEPPPGNKQQPFVSIQLVGKITVKDITTPFSLKTSVSQRAIDI